MKVNRDILDNLCINITDGEHASVQNDDEGKYFLLSNKNIINGRIIVTENERKISKETFNKINKRTKLEKGDLVISTVGILGKLAIIPDGNLTYDFQRSVGIIKCNENLLNTKYLYHYLNSDFVQLRLNYLSKGAVQKCLFISDLKKLEIDFPEIKTQQKIAKVLSDLDAKIELNNKINAELEAMAKTLYDHWFVQFDFPSPPTPEGGANTGEPYKTSGGKMVWNEELKREIPEGWEAQELEQIVDIISGNVSPNDIDKNTPYIGLEHIPRRTIVLSEWETAEKINSDKCIFKKHDILFGKIRPYFHKVGIAFIDGITSTDTIVLRPRENSCQGFALQTVFSDDFVETATNSSTGSKMPRANWNILKNYKIAIPSKKILDTYQLQFNNIIKKIELSVLENQELASLRDWLLPMLMNGQVSVGGYEVEDSELGMVAENGVEYKRS